MSHRHIRSLGFEAPGQPFIMGYDEGAPGDGQVRIETLYTGFSAGTELTFMKGTNPYLHAHWDGERGLFVPGAAGMHYPLPFMGYMEVGRVIETRAPGFSQGDVVASTYGHKTGHTAAPAHDGLYLLPPNLAPVLGIYVAQMGPIAANGILHADAQIFGAQSPRFGAGVDGRQVLVIGGGVVGMLTALFAMQAGAEVVLADPSPFRRERATALGLRAMEEGQACDFVKSHWRHDSGERGADFVFQTRAHPDALQLALRCLSPQGTAIDLAFYQGGADAVRLGEEFHHNGLAIVCAQINRVPRGLAPRWDRRRLAQQTIALLETHGQAIERELITHVVPFDEGPDFLRRLVDERPEFLQIVFKVGE